MKLLYCLNSGFAVGVWTWASEYFTEIPFDLPQIASESPIAVQIPSERVTPEQSRDLTRYDIGGYVDSCNYLGKEEEECQAKRDLARDFIYQHWRQKTRGYISVGYPCVDCGPTDNFFIEPDKNGQWRIVIRFEESRYGIEQLPNAYGVKFRRATAEEREHGDPPRVLSLLDKNGKEVRSF